MKKNFLANLPENDEEVKQFIDEMYKGVRAASAWGLYRARRQVGDTVLRAWEVTLYAVLGEEAPADNETNG